MKKLRENEEGKRFLACSFCGAPQRMAIPAGTVQVKCQYCGGITLVPPWMGGKILRCVSHPERLAVGICNDCGRNFCGECLRIYRLETRGERVTLYLDVVCLRRRYAGRADKIIWGGILLLAYGIFSAIVALTVGVLVMIFAGGVIVYGVFKRREIPTAISVDEILREREQREADPELKKTVDAEKLYNDLLAQYVHHWGAVTGTALLREEIRAFLRQGLSYGEAVEKVHARKRA